MSLRRRKKYYPLDRVYLARVGKPHGLKGEVKMQLFGCSPMLFEELGEVFIDEGDQTLKVEFIRGSEKTPIFKFEGIETRDQSEALAGTELWIKPERLPALEENAFYEADILLAQVRRPNGEVLGRVEDIIETGASDVLVVRDTSGNERLLPAILDVVKEVRKDEAVIIVEPLPEAN